MAFVSVSISFRTAFDFVSHGFRFDHGCFRFDAFVSIMDFEPETKAAETIAPETKAPETKAPETKARTVDSTVESTSKSNRQSNRQRTSFQEQSA
jgi:hypothetical protein